MLGFGQLGLLTLGQLPIISAAVVAVQTTAADVPQPRVSPRLAIALMASGATVDPWILTQPEQVTESRWHEPWSEPVRIPLRTRPGAQPYLFFHPNPFVPFGWVYPYSEPVRQKPGLLSALQQATTYDSELFPQPAELIQWFNNLSEPVRDLKVGLAVRLQMTLAAPERILPTPNVTVTIDAIEDNQDQAEFGIEVSDAADTAIVSIEEIPYQSDAVLSIREP